MWDLQEILRGSNVKRKKKNAKAWNARKGESWPLGLAEVISVSEGAGGSTKWLIHFPRDPLPPSAQHPTHMHTQHTFVHIDPGACLCSNGNIASVNPEGTRLGWKVMVGVLPLSVYVCFLAVKTTGWARGNMATTRRGLTSVHFVIYWLKGRQEERWNWSFEQSSAKVKDLYGQRLVKGGVILSPFRTDGQSYFL